MADRTSRAISVLQRAGFRGERLKTAFGIVMAESGGNPRAHNPNRQTGDDSYGLGQINMLGAMGPARRRQYGLKSNQDLFDPAVNARVMFQMSGGGRDFSPWSTFKSGAYRRHALPGATPSSVGAGPPAARPPQRAPEATTRPDPRLALALIDRSRARRGANPMDSWPLPPVDAPDHSWDREDRAIRGRSTDWMPLIAKLAMDQATNPGNVRTGLPKEASLAGLRLPATFKPTHRTSNLGWPAVDIMGKPGTTVGSPVTGTVVRWGSAQGGEALYLDGPDKDSEPDFWIGHVENRAPVGSRVKRGAPIARISAKHPRPHAHVARRGR